MTRELIRVLVVDDDPEDAELAADLLSDAGLSRFEVTSVDTYEDALAILGREPFDVCLVDYRLGARSGLDLLSEPTVQALGIPIIVLTGQGTAEVDRQAMEAGAADYLPKADLSASLLERAVHHAVQRTARARDAEQIRFQAELLNAVGQAVIATDTGGRVTYWNRAAEALFGWSAQEAVGRDVVELGLAERPAEDAAETLVALSAQDSWTTELRGRRKDGTSFAGLVTRAPIRNDAGETVGVVGVTSDISARLQTEEALRERVKELRTLSTVSHVVNRRDLPLRERLARAVDEIPSGWRWPERTAVRLTLGDREFASEGFAESPWTLSAVVHAGHAEGEGKLEIAFVGDPPEGGEAFLAEEHELADNLARLIGETVARERVTQMLSQTFASLQEAVVILDSMGNDRRIRYVNPAAERMFGLSWDDFIGRIPEDLHPSRESFERFGRQVRAELEKGRRFTGTFTLQRKDGEPFEAEQTVSLLDPQRGLEGGVVTIVRDVTEREAAARALRESEERFRDLAEHISDVFWVTTPGKDRMEYVSPAYEAAWGRSVDELLADPTHWMRAIVPEDRPRIADAASRQAEGDYDVTYRIRRPDGSIRWIHDRAFPVHDEGGRVTRIVGVAEDVTDRRLAEERFRVLGEEMTDVVLVIAPDSRVLFASASIEGLAGHSVNELVGTPALDLVHEDDRPAVADLLQDLVTRPEETARSEFRLLHRDGTTREVESVARNLLAHPAVRGIVVTTRDITERRTLEKRLRQGQKMEAVGRLAGGIAHDFNNILTVIRSETELLLLDHESAAIAEDLEVIRSAADRAANLTSQLLAFSREQVLRPRTVELADAVRDISAMIDRLAAERIAVVYDLEPPVAAVHVDPDQLQQVILNLVLNARDAMPEGGTLTLATDLESLDAEQLAELPGLTPGRYAVLRVSDTGTGMSQDTVGRIFDPFYTTKPTGKGTGLGLAMAYGFMKQSGGGIHVDTKLGEGSTFSLRFPLERGSAPPGSGGGASGEQPYGEDPAAPHAPPAVQGLPSGSVGVVLVVDDEGGVRDVTRRVMERAGFEVHTARDVESATALLEQGPSFDAVLTDLILPDAGGHLVAEHARRAHPGAAVLVMSGMASPSEIDGMEVPEGVTYLTKPFTRDQLLDAVRSAMEQVKGG